MGSLSFHRIALGNPNPNEIRRTRELQLWLSGAIGNRDDDDDDDDDTHQN